MKNMKKIISMFMAAALLLSLSACGENKDAESTGSVSTADPERELVEAVDWDKMSDIGEVNTAYEEGTGELYESGKTAGKIKGLCYYDFAETQPDIAEIFATRYGGTIETELTSSGSAYFERLSVLIQSGDSPDVVRYDWMAIPHGASKNLFTPLDGWLDMNSPLWSDEKDVIETFTYGGKHYYFPSDTDLHFMLNYNRAIIEDSGVEDPLTLYKAGDWTWDSFERICKDWASQGEDYTAYTGGSWASMLFIHTTGTSLIESKDNQLINNIKNPNVQRTMDWIENMKKQGFIGDGFVDPGAAFMDGKLLFLGMGPTWTYGAAQETLWKSGIESDMIVLPFPRDPSADKYYTSVDTYGFLVPAGAPNIQGGIDWILCGRLAATDPDLLQKDRETKLDTSPAYFDKCASCKYSFVQNNTQNLTVCPECDTPRKERYKLTYTAEMYDLLREYKDPDKFEFVFDFAGFFSDELNSIFTGDETTLLDGPMYSGASYTQLRETIYNSVESYLEPYREAMASFS